MPIAEPPTIGVLPPKTDCNPPKNSSALFWPEQKDRTRSGLSMSPFCIARRATLLPDENESFSLHQPIPTLIFSTSRDIRGTRPSKSVFVRSRVRDGKNKFFYTKIMIPRQPSIIADSLPPLFKGLGLTFQANLRPS
jgi:hypothetical protein